MTEPTTRAGRELLDAIVAIIDGEWGTGSPMEIAELREEYGEDLRAIEAEAAADSSLRKALEGMVSRMEMFATARERDARAHRDAPDNINEAVAAMVRGWTSVLRAALEGDDYE